MVSVQGSFDPMVFGKVVLGREAALFMRFERGEVGNGGDKINPSEP